MDNKFALASFVISIISLVLAFVAFIYTQKDFRKQNVVEFRKIYYSDIFNGDSLKEITSIYYSLKTQPIDVKQYKKFHETLINSIKLFNMLFLPTNSFRAKTLKHLMVIDDKVIKSINLIKKSCAPDDVLDEIEKELTLVYGYYEKFFNGDKIYF